MNDLRWLRVRELERLLGHGFNELADIAASAPAHYTTREESNGKKSRLLHIPKYPLRQIQRRLHVRVFRGLDPHPAAYAVRGRSALKAAEKHRNNRWFFHGDIHDFYPSVGLDRVVDAFLRLKTGERIAQVLGGLVTVEDRLPQGAPSSSSVGEMVLYPLDRRLWNLVTPHRLTYTRYADDLTISGGAHLRERLHHQILRIVRDAGWRLNEKGGIFGPNERHKLLGLVVNREVNAPKETYERIRFILRLAAKGHLSAAELDLSSIQGHIGWIHTTNPSRGAKLKALLASIIADNGLMVNNPG
jgi:RNA-directed DNA polymerase